VAGVGAITWAYDRAPVDRGTAYYPIFWVGLGCVVVSGLAFVLARSRTRAERLVVLVGAACVGFLPKLLMSTIGPRYYDEYFHWRQANGVVATGRLFLPNPGLQVVHYYPGLSAVTAVVHDLTGLSTWWSGQLLVLVAHLATMVGVFLLAECVWRDDRVAAVAALLYAVGPSFLYFDAQYGYESLALPFVVATLVCASSIRRARSAAEARRLAVVGVLVGIGCVVTHHLSAVVLAGLLLVVAVAALVRDRRSAVRAGRYTTVLALAVAAAVAVWIGTYARPTITYLSPYVTQALRQLSHRSDGPTVYVIDNGVRRQVTTTHQLFSQSVAPAYEKLAAYGAPVILAIGVLATVVLLRRSRRWPSGLGPYVVLAGLYFCSLPFTLVAAGGEGAHRSWAFSYVGVALVAAGGATWALDRVARTRRRLVGAAGFVTALALVTLGSQAVSEDTDYRFPGPYRFGSDTLGVTPELHATSSWFLSTYGPDQRLLTDRTSGAVLASWGRQQPLSYASALNAIPFAAVGPLPRSVINTLAAQGDDFMVVDKRITRLVGKHPPLGPAVQPTDPANIARYARLPWAQLVYESTDYQVYRFDFDAFRASGFAGTRP